MIKYVVYLSDWNGADEEAVFDNREDAEQYVANEEGYLSIEEDLYIAEEER